MHGLGSSLNVVEVGPGSLLSNKPLSDADAAKCTPVRQLVTIFLWKRDTL